MGASGKFDQRDDRVLCNLKHLRVLTQLIDSAWVLETSRSVRISPVLGGKLQNLSGLLHGFVNGVTAGYYTRDVRKRDAIATVGILVDQCDVVRHRDLLILIPARLPINRTYGAKRQVSLRMSDNRHLVCYRMTKLVMGPSYANQLEAVLLQASDNITTIPQHHLPPIDHMMEGQWGLVYAERERPTPARQNYRPPSSRRPFQTRW